MRLYIYGYIQPKSQLSSTFGVTNHFYFDFLSLQLPLINVGRFVFVFLSVDVKSLSIKGLILPYEAGDKAINPRIIKSLFLITSNG